MDYKIKYLKYKQKYFELKNNKKININTYNFLNGGNTDIKVEETKVNTDSKVEETKVNTDDNTISDDSIKLDAKKKEEEQEKFNKEINRPKVDQGRGLIGDIINCNKKNHFFNNLFKPSPWDYVEPDTKEIIPEKIPYTEFNQELINKIYLHKNQFEEGFNIGYIIGYECGINLDYTPEKTEVPGNISNDEFINGFINGWNLAFAKGKKYYYTKYLQLNNNNNTINENKNYDKYYIDLKKILNT